MVISKEIIEMSKQNWFPVIMKELGYVPVVRCKDCKEIYKDERGDYFCDVVDGNVDLEDFCSWGERKEEQ